MMYIGMDYTGLLKTPKLEFSACKFTLGPFICQKAFFRTVACLYSHSAAGNNFWEIGVEGDGEFAEF